MKQHQQPSVRYWVAYFLWMAAIFGFSSVQGTDLKPAFQFLPGDKILHFLAFAAGGALFATALRRTVEWRQAVVAVVSVAVLALFGGFDEWRQTFTAMRSGNDFGDWLADVLGASFGVSIGIAIHVARARHRADKKSSPRD